MDNWNKVKWIIGTLQAIEKIKIVGAVLELPAKQHCQFSLLTSKMGQMAWIGRAV